MSLQVIKIHPEDNVAVAVAPLKSGAQIEVEETALVVQTDIPVGHKIALKDLEAGEPIRKYGHILGHAAESIARGRWVHTHNLKTNLSDVIDYTYSPVGSAEPFEQVLQVASGEQRARNEENDYREIAIWKEGVTL